ncbi:uncharacterized protein LOC118452342 isoform X2 [Egretta garzetta]|uniref:uncharacterized protein LOC118452342 isoform X2 n=1 Tax=Egretta garzetta TaxID=188379 RepID=UPI00163D2334|nr:uncharacterized protein LOC118452342 isoform X2 [Egretta garzetta]
MIPKVLQAPATGRRLGEMPQCPSEHVLFNSTKGRENKKPEGKYPGSSLQWTSQLLAAVVTSLEVSERTQRPKLPAPSTHPQCLQNSPPTATLPPLKEIQAYLQQPT